MQYLNSDNIERPKHEFRTGRRGLRRGRMPNVKGRPSMKIGLAYDASPKAFFNKFLSSKFREKCMKDNLNMRAAMEGAGVQGNKYSDFVPFSLEDIDAFLGLFILNGINPKPRMDMWFEDSAIFGNKHVRNRFTNGIRR